MPETGRLPGSPPRAEQVTINPVDFEYAPVAGLWELREAVAQYYNRMFREGLPSQYTAENVAISAGGRLALTRLAASLGEINLGHFLPDYTAYEELLDIFRLFSPIPILLDRERGYAFTEKDLRREVIGRGLGAVLLSNPCNPTGKVIGGEALQRWVQTARECDCMLLFDEFYSHYVWRPDLVSAGQETGGVNSAAAYVEDVDNDPVVLLDGLTKNWRYPGWRVTWTVGPRSVIDAVSSAGSFLDGGGSRPLQRAAISLLETNQVKQESRAISDVFSVKKDKLLNGLRDLGFVIDAPPEGTFYVWASTEHLPSSLRGGMTFFLKALEKQVIVVPGEFFDVDPGRRRGGRPSRFPDHVRFSFGPTLATIERALVRLKELVEEAE